MKKRASGILLHITSLPSKFGIGDLGPGAYEFADFLCRTKQCYWQVLPLNPPTPASNNSPYDALSAFAGNAMLISPEKLVEHGYLDASDVPGDVGFDDTKVDYPAVIEFKNRLFDKAFEKFHQKSGDRDYEFFCHIHRYWLDDFALFVAICKKFNYQKWSQWPVELRDRHGDHIQDFKGEAEYEINREKFIQYIFFRQWAELKQYCNDSGLHIIGDIPIYTAYQSADVWAHSENFKLGEDKEPVFISGVPPDDFSETGQLWGNPVYDWDRIKENGFDWWMYRMRHNLALFDMTRVDHFRGFVGFWEVPAVDETAENGKWVEGPGYDFFDAFFKYFPLPPIIVEDLGMITPDVRELVQRLDLPGMKVLLFAFSQADGKNLYLPHNHVENSVVYTGTHDNNTARGWFESTAPAEHKRNLSDYLGRKVTAKDVHWHLIRLAMCSVARLSVVPMQDILGLGEEARMNYPSTEQGNWAWRFQPESITSEIEKQLTHLTVIFARG